MGSVKSLYSLVLSTVVILLAMSTNVDVGGEKLASVDFEIFGNVQGVCFRMYTEDQGKKLGVNGWVKNTREGTVIGQLQGPHDKVNEMKVWLSKVGSPSSRIDHAEFSNERDIPKLEIHGFGTRY
ncbi:acylphosphatase-2-like [Salvelinus alpinus]|uniref:Acylphosphatase n=2 Tax=Salvelinus TaxID=8033 RepID=A0A8U1F7P4_SALNM|nr:acylphosphatase-2 isoform X1 [Salvelinus alpinus]XP_038871418.1 acylphosphatase-2-like [Salvelinus namaycush]